MEKKGNGLNVNVPTAIIIAGLFVAGAIVFSNSPKGNPTNTNAVGGEPTAVNVPQQIIIAPITGEDHFYGNPNAAVVMVEFSDTECPFCKMFHPTAKKIVDESKGQVAWVYRHFPLDNIHPRARKEAEATECAAELGGNDKFWEYIDSIFAVTPSNNGLDPAELPKLAVQSGIDKTKFESCLDSGKYKAKVESQLQDGLKVGVSGTPTTVFMNRKGDKKLLVGAQPEASVLATINSLIK